MLAVKDTYARNSLRYNFSLAVADHPDIFHAKLPSGGANQRAPVLLFATLTVLPLILPCSFHRDRVGGALSSFHGPPRPSKLHEMKSQAELANRCAASLFRREECVYRTDGVFASISRSLSPSRREWVVAFVRPGDA